ncbi:MAG: hypothetical protein MJ227_01205 [Bacilli bacterium]|nr:hypothetical protein [Bacilli bacterium]
MFKTRRKEALEEAKKDPNFRPDKDLQVDESKLSPEEKGHFEIPFSSIIVFSVLLVLIVACVIVICTVGK